MALVLAILVTFTLALAPGEAHSQDLVLESWVGGPSAQERQWADGVRADLLRGGLLGDSAAIVQVLGMRVPLPALSERSDPVDPDARDGLMERFTAIKAAAEDGIRLYRRRRFQAAEKLISDLVMEAQRNPLIFATEVGRPVMRQLLIYLALCRSRLRQLAPAAAAAEEVVRSFPGEEDQIFAEFGPVADKLYRAALGTLTALGRGTLLVEVNDADAVIVVNQGIPSQRAYESEVAPGPYRVLIKSSRYGARRYEVSVRPHQTTRLTVDWRVDRALLISPDSVALVFDSDRSRQAEGALAASFARGIAAGPRVILLGARIYDGYRALSASVYEVASGRHLHTALAVMDGQRSEAKLAALATFLAGANRVPAPDLLVSSTPLPTVVADRAGAAVLAPSQPARWPAYLAGSAALASFTAGIVLTQLDGTGTCDAPPPVQCPKLYHTAAYGYALFGASVAFASYAAYRFTVGREAARRPRRSAAPRSTIVQAAVTPLRTGALAWLQWGF
jgi:hypothetical protein